MRDATRRPNTATTTRALLLAAALGAISTMTLTPVGPAPAGAQVVASSTTPAPAGLPSTGVAPVAAGLISIPTGSYVPQFADRDDSGEPVPVRVDAFRLDATPVTVAQYLAFLQDQPDWRRGRAPEVLVGQDYLADWREDVDPGVEGESLRRPVTRVSWFAARAYCQWRDARLPTTHEWEYAAAAGPDPEASAGDPRFTRLLRSLYASRPHPDALPPVGRTFRSHHGVHDLHGLVWEWTSDFNSRMASGAGREDQGLDRKLFCAAGSTDATDRSDYAAFLRWGMRSSLSGNDGGPLVGFRCAAGA